MDHAWYVRDVHEMRAWRRIGAVAWSFALAALFALAYITLTSTPTLRASAWATRLGVSLAFAATQLPPSALVAAMLRPSLAPLRVAGGAVGGGVDPWGVFAPPGSEARWAGARAPKHLFPAAFAASRWVSHTPPNPPPTRSRATRLGSRRCSCRTSPRAPRRARSSQPPRAAADRAATATATTTTATRTRR